MDAAILFFGLVWALLGRSSSTSSPPVRPPPQVPPELPPGQTTTSSPPYAPPPWPQVVPAELPPFPSSAWEFDEPPPPAVQQRARAILQQLWDRGANSYKAEQTNGRWIVYRAEVVASGKKGVVAYRLRKAAALPPARPRPPSGAPASTPPARPQAPTTVLVPARAPAAPASQLALPVLRRGMGAKPQAPRDDVKLLQSKLGIAQDGRFWNDTDKAVRAYQTSRGLVSDGVVGPATWAELFAVRA